MKLIQPHRNTLFCGIALALLMPQAGLAQDSAASATDAQQSAAPSAEEVDTLETVVVTGVRGSLARSVELKRESG
ncbi:MAG TPA: hypothetical protein VFH12_04380, partial [Pseudoxanthomonas sp.]|nr:hypothetical protein [Pseudoxanthomonas sp.]